MKKAAMTFLAVAWLLSPGRFLRAENCNTVRLPGLSFTNLAEKCEWAGLISEDVSSKVSGRLSHGMRLRMTVTSTTQVQWQQIQLFVTPKGENTCALRIGNKLWNLEPKVPKVVTFNINNPYPGFDLNRIKHLGITIRDTANGITITDVKFICPVNANDPETAVVGDGNEN